MPDDILFPIHLARQGAKNSQNTPFTAENLLLLMPEELRKKDKPPVSLCVEWGLTSCNVPWEEVSDALKQMLNEGDYVNSGNALSIRGEYCGKTLADILKESPQNTIRFDLLLPENRDKFNLVMACVGLPSDASYDAFAEKYGGITRKKYIELLKQRCR